MQFSQRVNLRFNFTLTTDWQFKLGDLALVERECLPCGICRIHLMGLKSLSLAFPTLPLNFGLRFLDGLL